MVKESLLEEGGTDEIVLSLVEFDDGEFDFDSSFFVEQVREDDSAQFLRQSIRDHSIECLRGIIARDQDFGESGYIHDAGVVSDSRDFMGDTVMDEVSGEGVMVVLFGGVAREPSGAFMAIDFFKNSALLFEAVIKRTRFDRSPRKPIEMRKRDFVAQAVIFFCFGDLPFFVGIVAESAGVKFAHRDIGRAMHHPMG